MRLTLITVLFFLFSFSNGGQARLKAVIFDDSHMLSDANSHPEREYIAEFFNVSSEEAFQLLGEAKIVRDSGGQEAGFWEDVAENRGVILEEGWFKAYLQLKMSPYQLSQEAKKLVQRLKNQGYSVGLISNVSQTKASYLKRAGFYDAFSPVILTCEAHATKPDARIFKVLLSRLKVSPNQCLMIDHHDEFLSAAKMLGMETIRFESIAALTQELEKKKTLEFSDNTP